MTEELRNLRTSSEGSISIICMDRTISAHPEPFLLSTLLFSTSDEFDVESPILCPELESQDVLLALGLLQIKLKNILLNEFCFKNY